MRDGATRVHDMGEREKEWRTMTDVNRIRMHDVNVVSWDEQKERCSVERQRRERDYAIPIEAIRRYCSLLLRLIDALYARNTICSSDRKIAVVVLDAEGTVHAIRIERSGHF